MIVDLLRNAPGRVCQPGLIQVPQLVGLESYRQVHHLTSVVRGHLGDGLSAIDLLRGQRLRAHTGCGIVADSDSDPAAEAEELGWKLQPLLEALA